MTFDYVMNAIECSSSITCVRVLIYRDSAMLLLVSILEHIVYKVLGLYKLIGVYMCVSSLWGLTGGRREGDLVYIPINQTAVNPQSSSNDMHA